MLPSVRQLLFSSLFSTKLALYFGCPYKGMDNLPVSFNSNSRLPETGVDGDPPLLYHGDSSPDHGIVKLLSSSQF
jgi:hypothetical protein